MSTYTLIVEIAMEDFKILKDSGYKLCLGRRNNGNLNVVWFGDVDYLSNNEFQWTDEFQVFGQNRFKVSHMSSSIPYDAYCREYQEGALVKSSTNVEDIQYGQTCMLDRRGIMHKAMGPVNPSSPFYVDNEYGNIYIGINCKLNDKFAPITVAGPMLQGTSSFMLGSDVVAWFSVNMSTGMMISDVGQDAFEVTVHAGDSETIAFSDGKWIKR